MALPAILECAEKQAELLSSGAVDVLASAGVSEPGDEVFHEVRELLECGAHERFGVFDAREVLSRQFQCGAFELLKVETKRLDSSWVDLRTEWEQVDLEWIDAARCGRPKVRHRKSWAEKGQALLLCGLRVRKLCHDSDSGCDKVYSIPEYCRMRGCPVCGEKQAEEFYKKWAPRLLGIARYSKMARAWHYKFRHLTFTGPKPKVRPSPKQQRVLWKQFLDCVTAFCREFYPGSLGSSMRFLQRQGCGFLIQGEVGRKKSGEANWNMHAHGLVFGPFYDVEQMKQRWTELTGASGYGLQVNLIGDEHALSSALHHMSKYYKKPFSYDAETYVQTLLGMHGVRLRRAGGIFYRDRRGSSEWSEKVEDWEESMRAHMEAMGWIRRRGFPCFKCGEPLHVDYRCGVLWRGEARDLGCASYEEVQRNRGSPSIAGLP